MDSETEKMYLENIEEFVMDENKIVTYKWLSKTLDIHVNTAKQLLYKYFTEKKGRIHVTYLIGGMLKDGPGAKILIVRENELDATKAQFKTITSEHVYSVQKVANLKTLHTLYGVDLAANKLESDKIGTIVCKNAIKRIADEVANLRLAELKPADPTKPVQKKTVAHHSKDTEVPKQSNDPLPAVDVKPTSAAQPESTKTLASMFSAQNKKNTTKAPASKNQKGKGIGAFFQKLPEKPTVAQAPFVDKSKEVKHEKEEELSSKEYEAKPDSIQSVTKVNGDAKSKSPTTEKKPDDASLSLSKVEEKKIESSAKSEKANKSASAGNGKKKGKSKKSQSTDKKRKRIMVMSDSDASDDDIFGKEGSSDEEIRPPTPDMPPEETKPVKKSKKKSSDSKMKNSQCSDEDIIPSTPVVSSEVNGKRHSRKRKLINKTYEDEDGYITTQKEYVFESCSEDENKEVPAKETVKPVEGKKKINGDSELVKTGEKPSKKKKQNEVSDKPDPVMKPKQKSIMSFFNKN